MCVVFFFLQAEDGIRVLVRSRGLGDVYKRQEYVVARSRVERRPTPLSVEPKLMKLNAPLTQPVTCLLYTSDAADERSSVDLGGRRIIKKKKSNK